MKSKPVEFKAPDEFVLPEGTEPGEYFDVVCTIRVKPNGTLCLVKLGDAEMPGYEDKDSDEKQRPEYGQARQMMTGESMMGGE